MLYLIGLGLELGDLTGKALSAVKKCKGVYLENYTAQMPYSVKELGKVLKKRILIADRELIENKEEILKEAKKTAVCVLVYGDVLMATTHIDLILRARKENIKVAVVHGISVFNAVTETGLQIYKFGKTASVPHWKDNFKPESFYDIIKENQAIKAHTLLLLDIGLGVDEALGYIRQIAKNRGEEVTWNFIVCSQIGTKKSSVCVGKIDELMKKKFELPACIIIPSALHFMEAEFLEGFNS